MFMIVRIFNMDENENENKTPRPVKLAVGDLCGLVERLDQVAIIIPTYYVVRCSLTIVQYVLNPCARVINLFCADHPCWSNKNAI
jgi:hypothetical protein